MTGDVSLACAALLAEELARAGVRHVCVSPGARSTPLVLAFARHGAFDVHVILDERSAAFFALGVAKASGVPAALVCTSGTAAANYHPAVIEAFHSQTPMIVLTADRPPEARGTGANQTIDQRELYGTAALWFFETPMPDVTTDTARIWRSIGARAALIANGPPAGPVHLNVPFREPLTPAGEHVDLTDAPADAGTIDTEPVYEDLTGLARRLRSEERGAIVVGGLTRPAPALLDLAGRLAWPVVAEPTSGLRIPSRALSAPQFLLDRLDARTVLYAGASPTSRATLAFLARAERVITVEPFRPNDPERRAALHVHADPQRLAEALCERIDAASETAWLRRVQTDDTIARATVDALLDERDEPFEGRVARDVAAAVPGGGVLAIGSSMPVRDLDLFMAPRTNVRVIGNRGASGIDGFISTTFGIAATGAPTVALMGDLTFLHDAGALAWLAPGATRATLVVVDNDGGGVFSFVPQAGLPEREALFATPHHASIEALAKAAGAEYRFATRSAELTAALDGGNVRVVHVRTEREDNHKRHLVIREAVERALAGHGF